MPEERKDMYRNTLREAAVIAGGEEALATRLTVPPEQLHRWLESDEEIPTSAFLDAVDVVVEAKVQEISGDRKSH